MGREGRFFDRINMNKEPRRKQRGIGCSFLCARDAALARDYQNFDGITELTEWEGRGGFLIGNKEPRCKQRGIGCSFL